MVNLPALHPQTLLPEALRRFFRDNPKLAIALSGGIDSRFLCHAASLCKCDIVAIHAKGPHIAPDDTRLAKVWAHFHNMPCREIFFDPLDLPEVATNSRNRCYFCKKKLLSSIKILLEPTDRVICDGGNADDYLVYRPGIQAIHEAGVSSPLALAGLSKNDIYRLARKTGLEFPDQKARPCLLTRLPYGMRIDKKILKRIAKAEAAISNWLEQSHRDGKPDFRLRLAPEPVLHLNCRAPELQEKLTAILAENGFRNCPIVVMQKLSGFFDGQASL